MQVVGSIDLTSSVPVDETVLFTAPVDGLYQLLAFLISMTPFPSPITGTAQVVFKHENRIGKQKATMTVLVDQPHASTSPQSYVIEMKAGTNFTYQTFVTATGGTPTYAVRAALIQVN